MLDELIRHCELYIKQFIESKYDVYSIQDKERRIYIGAKQNIIIILFISDAVIIVPRFFISSVKTTIKYSAPTFFEDLKTHILRCLDEAKHSIHSWLLHNDQRSP